MTFNTSVSDRKLLVAIAEMPNSDRKLLMAITNKTSLVD